MNKNKIYTNVNTAAEATRKTAESFSLSIEALKADNRQRACADMRSMMTNALRNDTALSLNEIGYILNRDHSCVMYNIRKVDNLVNNDVAFANRYKTIAKNLVNNFTNE